MNRAPQAGIYKSQVVTVKAKKKKRKGITQHPMFLEKSKFMESVWKPRKIDQFSLIIELCWSRPPWLWTNELYLFASKTCLVPQGDCTSWDFSG